MVGNGHYEMRFCGNGGQGLMILGDIMAQTAGCIEEKEIILTKSYGPEARGGASRSELIIDAHEIDDPVISSPNFMLAMSQEACDKYCEDMGEEGILLIDSDLVRRTPDHIKKIYKIPLTQIAEKATGKKISANMAALGAIAVLTGAVDIENIKTVISRYFPVSVKTCNEAAFEAGVRAAADAVVPDRKKRCSA